jgi:hypothetical protein
MSNPSNLYAEKIFSEHPLVLWALDEPSDYINLISEENRNVEEEWVLTGCTAVSGSESETPDPPFFSSISSSIVGEVPESSTGLIDLVSPDLVSLLDMNTDLKTVSVSTYFYSNSVYIDSVLIGIEYTDPVTSLAVRDFKEFSNIIYNVWKPLSATIEVPEKNADLRIFISVNTVDGGMSDSDYQFYLNGITCGQWSEEFNATSLGVVPIEFPSNIAVPGEYAIEADAYGLGGNTGYYLTTRTSLFAKNTSIPLVYGANGVTKLTNNPDLPSLIVPGNGFLNESGRYGEYTVEFWARINCDAKEPKRIFGPIASTDGLYVEPGFITLKIGDSFSSHFVGEWYRPMLIDIRVVIDSATLLINGEQVLSVNFDTENMQLPAIMSDESSQDWLGFYAYEDVPQIEIDCVAIYPYQVPISVAKRRWVYGQAVESPEGINSAYGGSSAFIDYTFANYAVNYSYPSFAQWQQGSFDNLSTSRNSLNTPEYSLPEIFLESKTLSTFYSDNLLLQTEANPFITFRPNSLWQEDTCYINFPNLNMLSDEVHSIYGIFKVKEDDLSVQTLFKIYNILNEDYFSVRKNGENISYFISFNGEEEEFHSEESFPLNQIFAVGFQIEKLAETFGGNISSFFGNQNSLRVYVGGDEEGNTFSGNIYSVGFSTDYNSFEISDHFDSEGFALFNSGSSLLDHTASYTLLPTRSYENFYLDIGVSGYWQDYMPLSYFAKTVKNDIGNEYLDLDFLQINLDYPVPGTAEEVSIQTELFTYLELQNSFKNPEQRTYADLDNFLFTNWSDYQEMATQTTKEFFYNTDESIVKSYISFQYVEEGANRPKSQFATIDKSNAQRVLDIADHPNWYSTIYEVLDNTIVYPPKSVDFNEIALVYYLEFRSRGILTKPIKLKNFAIASQALNDNSFNPIGTRFGNDIFPYSKSGIYYDYKFKNPFSIYKGSTPYLYMTKNSGIEVRGKIDNSINRGLNLPINQAQASEYKISALQLWYINNLESFSFNPTPMFEIVYDSDTLKFYSVATNTTGSRAKIFAIQESTNKIIEDITYYINGKYVAEPTLTIGEWSVVGLSFSNAISFDSFLGSFNLNGLGLYNNISYYQANNLQQVQSKIYRPWIKVYEDEDVELTWSSWTGTTLEPTSWDSLLTVSTSELYSVNPSEVYSTYIGTNKIIIDDQNGMIFDAEKLRVFESVEWSTATVVPV